MEENPEKSEDNEGKGQVNGKMFFLPGEKVCDLRLHPQEHPDTGQD